MARAEATGPRLMAARATLALSTMRQAIISTTSRSSSRVEAATSAIFQASCASEGRLSAEGWTRTAWVIMETLDGEACRRPEDQAPGRAGGAGAARRGRAGRGPRGPRRAEWTRGRADRLG